MEQAALIPSPNNLEDHSKALITPLPPISHEEPNATSPAGDFVIDTPPAHVATEALRQTPRCLTSPCASGQSNIKQLYLLLFFLAGRKPTTYYDTRAGGGCAQMGGGGRLSGLSRLASQPAKGLRSPGHVRKVCVYLGIGLVKRRCLHAVGGKRR